jgi:hypothetical protein
MLVLTGAMAGHAVQSKSSSSVAAPGASTIQSSTSSSLFTSATAAQPAQTFHTQSHGS